MEIATLTETITIFVSDTLNQSDLIDPYKELIEAQRSTYNFIIYIFLGILGLFSFAAAYVYIKKTKDWVKENTKEIFNEERKNIISSIKKEYDTTFKELGKKLELEFAQIEATSSRLFSNNIDNSDPANKMAWMFSALEHYLKINSGRFITNMVNNIKLLCIHLTDEPDLKKKFIDDCKKVLIDNSKYSSEYFFEILNIIPDTLADERNVIRTFFDSIKDEISRGEKEEETNV